MAEVCIICHAEKSGERVADTSVIRAIRTVKERLNMATRNTLVVCPGLHRGAREAAEKL